MASYGGQAADGLRAARLGKARQTEIEEAEFQKKKLANSLKVDKMETKFAAHFDSVENEIKASTVGLVTIDQMKQTQERALLEREKQLVKKEKEKLKEEKDKKREKEKRKEKERQKVKTLSFNMNDDEDEDGEEEEEEITPPKKKRFGMNPNVNTSFLPDRERDEEENQLREKLRLQWEEKQKLVKEEEVQITYSYWDGSGHRKNIFVKKGNTIYQFLCKVLEGIRGEFPELKMATADQLMFVKEDLIIPQHNTFYEFIVSRARGKTGALFQFDVHDDVRLLSDATIEKDETHAGKVVLRSWYDRNKHIFPASRWEPYDPTKVYQSQENKLDFTTSEKNFTPADISGEGGEDNVLLKLAKGSASGCRGMCKCSKSTVCEMHYQAKNYR
eukprot:TRINITY_DN26041_c0_g1_i1.p1 TRINITY_DN26041_c0_g1~~TRINITY_DN26041_c0_g1_i1.p1  ORF type:complete len:388 (+),score=83.58 TRINITY_DN26041_c0_g1_i1:40-1203(+)